MLLGFLKNQLSWYWLAELIFSEATDGWSYCWPEPLDWAPYRRSEPWLIRQWVWIKTGLLVIAEVYDVEIPLGKVVEVFKTAALKDNDLDILELFEMLDNLWSKRSDLDLTEVHLLNFVDLVLVLFESVFNLTECAHSKCLILWSILNLNLSLNINYASTFLKLVIRSHQLTYIPAEINRK